MDVKSKTIHFYILPVFYIALALVVVSEVKEPWSIFGLLSSILTAIAALSAAFIAYRNYRFNKVDRIDKRIRILNELSRDTLKVYFEIMNFGHQWNKISKETLDNVHDLAVTITDNEHLLPASAAVGEILQKYILFQNCAERANRMSDEDIKKIKVHELHDADLVRWFYENRTSFGGYFNTLSEQLKQEVLDLKEALR